jgi:hypothetical protein
LVRSRPEASPTKHGPTWRMLRGMAMVSNYASPY